MKLLVVSDVHGDYDALEQAYRAEKNVGAVIFLGDGIREAERFEAAHGALRVSMGRLTTERDVGAFAEAMDTVLNWK